jgi:phosphocarrier protein
MVTQKTKIVNEQGMHMRPASLMTQKLAKYASTVNIVYNGKSFNAKSVMMLMSACMKYGSEVEVKADGPDENEALKEVVDFIDSGLGD